MKLQFNLLPDVKQEYLKTQRTKRTVITAAVIAASISLFILLFCIVTVYVVNKKQLSDADKDVTKYSGQLQSVKNLDKILTIQNQLNSISTLHQSKHQLSRLYTYLPQLTPSNVCMSQFAIDLTANTITLKGDSDSQKTINTFIDTMKFTKYTLDGKDSGKYAFPSVIESSFNINSGSSATSNSSDATKCNGQPAAANFSLTISFDPALFSNAQKVTLSVPQGLVTTRSVLQDPSFNGDVSIPVNQAPATAAGGQ